MAVHLYKDADLHAGRVLNTRASLNPVPACATLAALRAAHPFAGIMAAYVAGLACGVRIGKTFAKLPPKRSMWISDAEINNELKALKRMFSLAIAAGKLAHRPHIAMLKEDNVRTGFFEREQFEAVRRHLPDYLPPLVTFMYLTGWRRGEVSGLEWRQVDLDAGEVRLDPGSTKNGEGRVFPFTHELRELLKAQHVEHERLKKAGQIEPWVFFRLTGRRGSRVARREAQKPRPIGNFRKTWMAACRAAGCPGRIPHDFRRGADGHPGARGDAAHRPQDAVGFRALQHRVLGRPARGRAEAR